MHISIMQMEDVVVVEAMAKEDQIAMEEEEEEVCVSKWVYILHSN